QVGCGGLGLYRQLFPAEQAAAGAAGHLGGAAALLPATLDRSPEDALFAELPAYARGAAGARREPYRHPHGAGANVGPAAQRGLLLAGHPLALAAQRPTGLLRLPTACGAEHHL